MSASRKDQSSRTDKTPQAGSSHIHPARAAAAERANTRLKQTTAGASIGSMVDANRNLEEAERQKASQPPSR
ncbi:MAG: hypothetical protein K0S38_871 [Candidatus Paceibacter sp.]|jgi:hypothetical protein|nr:hypothetical protein [Candidatus Paceibacter sp.]